jgi:DNA ligase (NAD+)
MKKATENPQTAKVLVETLVAARHAYYSGRHMMSDKDFDTLEDTLRDLDPDNDYFKTVGVPVQNIKQKFTHTIPMLSCDKVKSIPEIEKWLRKIDYFGKPVVIQNKIDGLSADLTYQNGKFVSAATRGDGHIGQNVTKLMQFIRFPKTIPISGTINIRGEFVIFRDSTIENPDNTNLRNICAGLISSKTVEPDKTRHIHFIGYQVYGSPLKTESSKIDFLAEAGFETTDYVEVSTLKEIEDYYNKYVNKLRDEFKYATDGLVLVVNDSTLHASIDKMGSTDHDHLYAKALKPPNESAETTLERIEWQVSRNGRLIPVAIFKPVVIDGSTITKASLNNYANVLRMKMEIGDKLEIVKAGAIIPYVEKNITKGISQR